MSVTFSDSHDSSDRPQADIDWIHRNQFGPGRWIVGQHTHTWQPPTDVFETDDAMVVRVEVAGMREADFNVTLRDHLLLISGVRTDPSPKVAYHQLEIRYGEFRTDVPLHWLVDEEGVTATYQDGFLLVRLPKAQSRRVRVVEIGEHSE